MINEWQEAKKDTWIDKRKVQEMDDPLQKDMLDSLKVAYQTGKGNNHLVPVLFPNDTIESMNRLCDPEIRAMAGISKDNMYVFACIQNSSSHVLGWHAVNSTCTNAGVKDSKRINATKNRHRVSTMYAAFDLPEAKRALFFKHMGHSKSVNENIYQTPLAIQEVTDVGSLLTRIDEGGKNIRSATSYSPSSSRRSATSQSPGNSRRSTTSQSPGNSQGSATSQSPGNSRGSATSQSPGNSLQSATSQSPGNSLQSATSQSPGNSRRSTTSQSPGNSRGSATSQSPGNSRGSATSQSPGNSLQSATSQSPGNSRRSTTSQSPGNSRGSATSQSPGNSRGSATSQSPGNSRGSATSQSSGNSLQSATSRSLDSRQSATGAANRSPKKDRIYTRWSKAHGELVASYFMDIIKGRSGRSVPGKRDVQQFLEIHQLDYSCETVRNKVMNERVKWERTVEKRSDEFLS